MSPVSFQLLAMDVYVYTVNVVLTAFSASCSVVQ